MGDFNDVINELNSVVTAAGDIASKEVAAALQAVTNTEDIVSEKDKATLRRQAQDLFIDATIRTILGPFAFGLGAISAETHNTLRDAVRNLLINTSSFVLGYSNGISAYAERRDAVEFSNKLLKLYIELSSPDDDGIFLLRKSFLKGLYDGLGQVIGGLQKLANGLADYLALASVRGQVDATVAKVSDFLFSSESEPLGHHREHAYVMGFQSAIQAVGKFEETLGDQHKFSHDLGALFGQMAAEIALEKGMFKIVDHVIKDGIEIPILKARVLGSNKLAPGLDDTSRSLINRLDDNVSQAVWIRTGSTDGITLLKVREKRIDPSQGLNGMAIEVEYRGELKTSMPRSKASAIEKILSKGSSPPIAPNYNTMMPANSLKPGNFKDANGIPLNKIVVDVNTGQAIENPVLVDGKPKTGQLLVDDSWERAHTYGPGWGDEGGAGIWLAHRNINNIMQNYLTERFARRLRDYVQDTGFRIEVEVKTECFAISALPDSYKAELSNHPLGAFLRKATYNYKVTKPNGDRAELEILFELNSPPDGNVSSFNIAPIDLNNDFNKSLRDFLNDDINIAFVKMEAAKRKRPR